MTKAKPAPPMVVCRIHGPVRVKGEGPTCPFCAELAGLRADLAAAKRRIAELEAEKAKDEKG